MSSLSKSGGLSLKSRFPLFGTSEQPATAPGLWMGLTHPRFARSPGTPGLSLSRHRRHREGHRSFPWGGVRRNAILRVLSTLPKVEKARQTGGLWVCVCVCVHACACVFNEREEISLRKCPVGASNVSEDYDPRPFSSSAPPAGTCAPAPTPPRAPLCPCGHCVSFFLAPTAVKQWFSTGGSPAPQRKGHSPS